MIPRLEWPGIGASPPHPCQEKPQNCAECEYCNCADTVKPFRCEVALRSNPIHKCLLTAFGLGFALLLYVTIYCRVRYYQGMHVSLRLMKLSRTLARFCVAIA
jgi:hypothetical protein